jgi:hypothetical protein
MPVRTAVASHATVRHWARKFSQLLVGHPTGHALSWRFLVTGRCAMRVCLQDLTAEEGSAVETLARSRPLAHGTGPAGRACPHCLACQPGRDAANHRRGAWAGCSDGPPSDPALPSGRLSGAGGLPPAAAIPQLTRRMRSPASLGPRRPAHASAARRSLRERSTAWRLSVGSTKGSPCGAARLTRSC